MLPSSRVAPPTLPVTGAVLPLRSVAFLEFPGPVSVGVPAVADSDVSIRTMAKERRPMDLFIQPPLESTAIAFSDMVVRLADRDDGTMGMNRQGRLGALFVNMLDFCTLLKEQFFLCLVLVQQGKTALRAKV